MGPGSNEGAAARLDIGPLRRATQNPRLRKWKHRWDVVLWKRRGKRAPVPHLVKQAIVREHAKQFELRTLVETGTYLGDMVWATIDIFDEIYSIELDEFLFRRAQAQFSNFDHVRILQGESVGALPEVLTRITRPCLFWLDAHYSGGVTARGTTETPIMEELECILGAPSMNHVMLIDDARCFVGANGYPTMEQVKELVARKRPGWLFESADDIIRVHPPR
jgi:hypothetical protein